MNLIAWIYDHLDAQGWLKPDDPVLDCFAGTALGAYHAMQRGYRWLGVELEQPFVDIGRGCDCTGISKADWVRYARRASQMRYKEGRYWCPRCVQQASQQPTPPMVKKAFRPSTRSVAMEVCTHGIYDRVWVSEPSSKKLKVRHYAPLPFPDRQDGVRPQPAPQQGLFASTLTATYQRNSHVIPHTTAHRYEGNLDRWAKQGLTGAILLQGDSRNLPTVLQEAVECMVTSPPYADSWHDPGKGWLKRCEASGVAPEQIARYGNGHGMNLNAQGYGASPGQLGAMPPGRLGALVTSPDFGQTTTQPTAMGSGKGTRTSGDGAGRNKGDYHYSTDPRKLGNMREGCVQAVVTSPVYHTNTVHDTGQDGKDYYRRPGLNNWGSMANGHFQTEAYSTNPANLGNLPPGPAPQVECVVTSPPFSPLGSQPSGQHQGVRADYRSDKTKAATPDSTYGKTDGQLAALPTGLPPGPAPQVECVVTSSPYQGSTHVNNNPRDMTAGKAVWNDGTDSAARVKQDYAAYAIDTANLGNAAPTTFWEASAQILRHTYDLLVPGGHAVFVTGPYVRNGQLVDFPAQWAQLCQDLGFQLLHTHIMLKQKRYGVQHDLFTGAQEISTDYVSFFRRMASKKNGAAVVNYEVVHCFVKTPSAAALPPDHAWQQEELWQWEAVVASSPYAGAGEVLGTYNGIDFSKAKAGGKRRTPAREAAGLNYGQSDGQLGAMPTGQAPQVTCLVSSPAYGGNEKSDYLLSGDGKTRRRDEKRPYTQGYGCFRGSETYGQSAGQLGAMRTGAAPQVTCLVTSPVYGCRTVHDGTGIDLSKSTIPGGTRSSRGAGPGGYGSTAGNLDALPTGTPPSTEITQ